MIIFNKEKFIKVMGQEHYNLICANAYYNWIDILDGTEVINGYIEMERRKV